MAELDDRLRTAYAQALKSSHDGGRVEIHVGEAVYTLLKQMAERYYAWEEGLRASFVDVDAKNPYPAPEA
jgi:hypothetical protein